MLGYSINKMTDTIPSVGRRAPKEVNYSDVLPVALASSSNRRQFLPNNGQVFRPNGSNIIRIDVNADSLLDASNSYLQFTVANDSTSVDANTEFQTDGPMGWCSRLRIESGGITLEDIYQYGRLYSLLQKHQVSDSNLRGEGSVFGGTSEFIFDQLLAGAQVTDAGPTEKLQLTTTEEYKNYATTTQRITSVVSRTYCVPLVSALLNCEKYIPLILANSGITLEFTLGSAESAGVQNNTTGPAVETPTWEINSCRYVAHLVEMDSMFYDALRSEMAVSGSISLHGHTWKHYGNSIAASDASPTLNIPARMKSIKCILSTFKAGTTDTTAGENGTTCFCRENIKSWQYKVGAINYPQSAVSVSATALSATLCEVQKAFGKLNDVSMSSSVSQTSFAKNESGVGATATNKAIPTAGTECGTFCIGYDTESFSRSSLESGINTADRALPISLELTRDSGGVINYVVTNDNYVCSDLFIYVNSDGTFTPSN